MSKVLGKISQLIASSNIPGVDQNDLLIFLPALPDELLNDLCKIFEKDKRYIEDFNENFKARLQILIDGRDEWERLIAQEEEMLKREEGY